MGQTKQEKLSRIKNRGTLYEIVASHADGRRLLIAYAFKRSRAGIMRAIENRADDIIRALGLQGEECVVWRVPAAKGCTIGSWSISFSGRTQRDAIIEGELLFIGKT